MYPARKDMPSSGEAFSEFLMMIVEDWVLVDADYSLAGQLVAIDDLNALVVLEGVDFWDEAVLPQANQHQVFDHLNIPSVLLVDSH